MPVALRGSRVNKIKLTQISYIGTVRITYNVQRTRT